MISSLLDPSKWGLPHLLVLIILMTGLNLFGPRGFVHLYYLKKESERVDREKLALTETINQLERDMERFRSSKPVRSRAIRQHLGYLKDNEISVELPSKLKNEQAPTRTTKILR